MHMYIYTFIYKTSRNNFSTYYNIILSKKTRTWIGHLIYYFHQMEIRKNPFIFIKTKVSPLNSLCRDNLYLMKCFNFHLVKFCSINIKCWGDTSSFKWCRVFFLSSSQWYSMSRYYSDVFKLKNALASLSAINLHVWVIIISLTFQKFGRISSLFQQMLD